ncbi:hypothetical protein NKDENANG_02112 [Candidatus Entotheonellaceae bacterium PAL068K]
MKRFVFIFSIIYILSFIFLSSAFPQTTLYSQQKYQNLHYKPGHFIWLHVENGRLQRDDLLPFLSRQHVVIVLEQPDDVQKRRVQAVLENPPAAFPEIDILQVLPPPRTDAGHAIGYIHDRVLRSRLKASDAFAAYLVTFTQALRMARLFQALHDFAHTPEFHFVLPVFFFPDKAAAPFMQFEVEFLSPELIPGGIDQINKTNSMNFVKETQQTSNFQEPVVLQLQRDAPTNILATILRYHQMPWIVKGAKLRWLRLRMPVEVQARWALPIGINSFGIWEPIRYMLSIERDRDVELLPKAFTMAAVHAWISENTHLPDELIQVDRITKQTQSLEDGRMLDEVSLMFRLSKTGTYVFSPYPVQATYRTLTDQRRIDVFRGDDATFLMIPGHLPRQLSQIPGQLLAVPEPGAPFWVAPSGMLLGIGCMVVGLVYTLRMVGRSFGFITTNPAPRAESPEPTLEALRVKYRGRLKEVQQRAESLTFHGQLEPERSWLRFLSVFLKRLLGERCYQDETHLLGGLGATSNSIRQYMLATSANPNNMPIAEALSLLQILEQQVLKKTLSLSRNDTHHLLSKAEIITEEIFC